MFDRTAMRDLDTSQVLDQVVTRRRDADRAEADLLALVVHYVDLHPASDDQPAAGWGDRTMTGASGLPGPVWAEGPGRLAGDGTPSVTEDAVIELGAALHLGYHTTLELVTDAVELCHRLPRLWALVQDGRLQAWKARKIAAETTHLSKDAAGFVDRHLADTARRNRLPSPGKLRDLVAEALLRCDPDTAARLEQAERDHRGVWFDHRDGTATTRLTATLDTLHAVDLDATLTDLAGTLARLGDTDPLDIRRATALGILASPQHALDLSGHPDAPDPTGGTHPTHSTDRTDGTSGTHSAGAGTQTTGGAGRTGTRSGCGVPGGIGGSRTAGMLYLHVTAADLATGTGGGRIERLGSTTLDLLRAWLHRMDHVTVRPVLDLTTSPAVDTHDPPPLMREQVILRDRHCVFPGCRIDARACDLDHIETYVPPDDGGPPGQTNPGNLACLCRRHHRTKTFTAWTYHRTSTGRYRWTSPHGRTYLT